MELIYPWEFEKFTFEADKGTVATTRGHFMEKKWLPYPQPNDKVARLITVVVQETFKRVENGGIPWTLLVSEDMGLLSAVSLGASLTICLSRPKCPWMPVSTDMETLLGLWKAGRPKDVFDADREGLRLEEITYAGVLWLEGISMEAWGIRKFESGFYNILRKRMGSRLPTIFTIPVAGKEAASSGSSAISVVEGHIAKVVGAVSTEAILNNSNMLYMRSQRSRGKMTTVDV